MSGKKKYLEKKINKNEKLGKGLSSSYRIAFINAN